MNAMTLFLSQLMGPVVLLMGISFALNHDNYVRWFKRYDKEDALLFFISVVELTVGIAVVLSHNFWDTLPQILISLIGWGMVLEGGLVLVGSKEVVKRSMMAMSKSMGGMMSAMALASIVIGAYLSWYGYLA